MTPPLSSSILSDGGSGGEPVVSSHSFAARARVLHEASSSQALTITARLIDLLANPNGAAQGPLASALESNPGRNLRDVFLSLSSADQANLRSRLGQESLDQLFSISLERNSEFYFQSLNHFAIRLRQSGRVQESVAVFSAVLETAPQGLSDPRTEAQQELNAINGVGGMGRRFEFLSQQFVEQAVSPTMLLAMGGAQTIYGVSRLGFLSRLVSSPGLGILSRGIFARGVASTLAFSLEGASFFGIHRGLNAAMGVRQDWSRDGVLQELAGTYLTLGALKLSSMAGNAAYESIHRVDPLTGLATRWTGAAAATQSIVPQLSTLGGLYLGNHLETRAGLRPVRDNATTLLDSLVTLAQFGISGRVMHGAFGPGFEQFNRELHIRSELAEQQAPRPSFAMGEAMSSVLDHLASTFNPAGELVTPNGIRIPAGKAESLESLVNRPVMMAMESPDSKEPSNSIPPSGVGPAPSVPPPPASGNRPSRRSLGSRFLRGLQEKGVGFLFGIGKVLDLNIGLDPAASLGQVPTRLPASPVANVREGIWRAQALGQNRRALAFLRWGAHQLRNLPETQQRFLNHMQRVFTFQVEQQKALDPILRGFPELDFESLNSSGEAYSEALRKLAPDAGPEFAKSILMRERIRGWDDILTEMSEETLRDMGIDSSATLAMQRNAQAFTKGDLIKLLDHPLLRDLPESAKLLEARRVFEESLREIHKKVEANAPRIKALRLSIAKSDDVSERKAAEKEIQNLGKPIGMAYLRATGALQGTMEAFLKDPARARTFLIQTALHSTVIRGAQDADPNYLRNFVRENREQLTDEAGEAANRFLEVAEQKAIVDGRSALSRFFFAGIRFVGLDRLSPLVVQGRYEQALLDLVEKTPINFWDFGPVDRNALEHARVAQTRYNRALHVKTQQLRETFKSLEKANNAYWEIYDREAIPLYVEDLRIQVQQVQEEIAQFQDKPLGGKNFSDEHGERYRVLLDAAEKAIQEYNDPSSRGNNSRDAGRTLETALKQVAELRGFVQEKLHETFRTGHKVKPVSALMLPYATKASQSWHDNLWESVKGIWPMGWRTLVGAPKIFSGVARGSTTDVADQRFMNWAAGITRATESNFVVDSHVDHLVEAEPLVVSGNHNAWLDFLGGGTPFARAAQLGDRARAEDSLRIAAKQGLGSMLGPALEPMIELLTESVADDAPSYDGSATNLARGMAFGELPGGRINSRVSAVADKNSGNDLGRVGPRSSAVFDELTMATSALVSPFAFDPFPAISSILAAPLGGRSFIIADRATALTGRPQNLLMTSTLNAYRLWPKPDIPFPLRDGPMTTVTQFLPALALTDINAEGRNGVVTRANWLRTFWLNMGTMPEYQRPVPSIEKTFESFNSPLDPATERTLESMFGGAMMAGSPAVYPTAEGVRTIEGFVRDKQVPGMDGTMEAVGHDERHLLDRVLDTQTSQFLRTRMQIMDQQLENLPKENLHPDEVKGARRLQRILRARLKTLDSIDRKSQTRQPLTRIEQNFLEKAGAALGARSDTSGRDRILEQISHLIQTQEIGETLTDRLLQTQEAYNRFINEWNEARRDPNRPEHAQIHVSESPGFQKVADEYRVAVETAFNIRDFIPRSWEGEMVPDMVFRREGDSLVIEPRGWQPSKELSRATLWRFLLDDTLGIVKAARNMGAFDQTSDLYQYLHKAGWGYRMMNRVQLRIRLNNTDRLIPVAAKPSIVAPTHDSGVEFPTIPAVMHDYGIRCFFMADEKFFKTSGPIRALLGPMEIYGHMSINRKAGRSAITKMVEAGRFIREKLRSMIIYPAGTRNEVKFDEEGRRYEGIMYGSRIGVAYTLRESNAPMIPIGLVHGGEIFPKQVREGFTKKGGGAALGQEYVFNFGHPIFFDQLLPDTQSPTEAQMVSEVPKALNRQYHELTGREVGPIAPKKVSIFDKVLRFLRNPLRALRR